MSRAEVLTDDQIEHTLQGLSQAEIETLMMVTVLTQIDAGGVLFQTLFTLGADIWGTLPALRTMVTIDGGLDPGNTEPESDEAALAQEQMRQRLLEQGSLVLRPEVLEYMKHHGDRVSSLHQSKAARRLRAASDE